MCEHDLTMKDYRLILDMFDVVMGEWGGLDNHEEDVYNKIKKLYNWSLL